jgi:hypothetical protein
LSHCISSRSIFISLLSSYPISNSNQTLTIYPWVFLCRSELYHFLCYNDIDHHLLKLLQQSPNSYLFFSHDLSISSTYTVGRINLSFSSAITIYPLQWVPSHSGYSPNSSLWGPRTGPSLPHLLICLILPLAYYHVATLGIFLFFRLVFLTIV